MTWKKFVCMQLACKPLQGLPNVVSSMRITTVLHSSVNCSSVCYVLTSATVWRNVCKIRKTWFKNNRNMSFQQCSLPSAIFSCTIVWSFLPSKYNPGNAALLLSLNSLCFWWCSSYFASINNLSCVAFIDNLHVLQHSSKRSCSSVGHTMSVTCCS